MITAQKCLRKMKFKWSRKNPKRDVGLALLCLFFILFPSHITGKTTHCCGGCLCMFFFFFFCMGWLVFCYGLGSKGRGDNLFHHITDFFSRSSFDNWTRTELIELCHYDNKEYNFEELFIENYVMQRGKCMGGCVAVYMENVLCLLFQIHQANIQRIQTSFGIIMANYFLICNGRVNQLNSVLLTILQAILLAAERVFYPNIKTLCNRSAWVCVLFF